MQVPGLEFQCKTSRYNVIELNFYTAHKVTFALLIHNIFPPMFC